MKNTVYQFIKDLIMPFWNSDSANNNQTPSAEKPAINSGDHAQPKQIGDHITQHTPIGP
ncbi:MAG: hypothetical protein AABY47_03665 [Pseudomonadota bacterium]